jgi:hypothetical protein
MASDGIRVHLGAITTVKHANAGSAMSASRFHPDDVSAEY